MATLLECLSSLPNNLVMRDLAATHDDVATVAEHIARLHHDQDGHEVRKESRYYKQREITAIGQIGGPAMYRQV
ncbi:hypothetical protein [Caballeronia sp. LZ043]|uniref:hypothetical protein n=1 Tax=Caballeronia sp. LZ043 TaxID=3038569 RepID=UPI0028621E6F|nr:hypothetical protein [Caballeronia sp. LZ043]MDR5825992.1 hypothetical protein [Caballeronia sp. LZ043]